LFGLVNKDFKNLRDLELLFLYPEVYQWFKDGSLYYFKHLWKHWFIKNLCFHRGMDHEGSRLILGLM